MTIDINELRKVIADCYWPTSPVAINELLDCLEAAEKSDAESLAMYRKARDERDALRAALQHEADCVEAAKADVEVLRAELAGLRSSMKFRTSLIGRTEAERDALRAKIAEMEKQEHMDANELTTFYVWCPSLGITRNDAWEIQHTEAYCAVEVWGEEYSMDNPRSPTGRDIYVEGGDVVEPLTYVLHTALGYYALPGAQGEEK